jgi:class 3 adenylate cyclase
MQEPALLAVLDGAENGRRIRVAGQLTVGRDDDAGLLLDDPEISRAHATLVPADGGLEIRDLGSLNGTWVNGERISSPTVLAPGDVVKVGTTRIEVLAVGGRGLASVPRSSPTPVEAEDELRPVSVLFADVVGSTPLAERLDPEEYAALIGGCVDRMCRAVEQFGGVIDAYMGDGIAAFFGFPAATEDDAERAATAALAVVKAIDAYADEVRETWTLPDLNVRVGVNSGQVAIGVVGSAERHPVALGDTMNVAARLQGTAEPGTIVIGGATARKLRGRFLVAPLGHVAVRGRERPVEAWRLLSPRSDRRRSETSGFVGRSDETALLASAADALRAGRGGLPLVDGEPGIGKTRLLEWLCTQVGDDVTWLKGTASHTAASRSTTRLRRLCAAGSQGTTWRSGRPRWSDWVSSRARFRTSPCCCRPTRATSPRRMRTAPRTSSALRSVTPTLRGYAVSAAIARWCLPCTTSTGPTTGHSSWSTGSSNCSTTCRC